MVKEKGGEPFVLQPGEAGLELVIEFRYRCEPLLNNDLQILYGASMVALHLIDLADSLPTSPTSLGSAAAAAGRRNPRVSPPDL